MTSAEREALARTVLDKSKADATEIIVSDGDRSLTRFTHNSVHQNVASTALEARLRVVVDGRTGVASTGANSQAELEAALSRAIELAGFAPRDPNLAPLSPGGAFVTPMGAWDDATHRATPAKQAQIAGAIFTVAEQASTWAAGYVSTSRDGITIANSDGVMASYESTDAACNAKLNAADSTGYAERFAQSVSALDGAAIGKIAAEKARLSAAPRAVEPGEWTVILEPAAFGELFAYITDHFSAQSYDEGSSFFSGALGSAFAGENVTVVDDFAHPLHTGMPFDYEGSPTQRVVLLEHGKANAVVTDVAWAKKLDRPNTGHGLPAPNGWGPQPRNVVIEAGTKSVEQLIAETKRGLLVTRFWYIRTVDQRKTIVTGMTRDGTFLIENGKLAGGVRNMRFNQSIIEALGHCEFANAQARTAGYSYSIVVPAAKIDGFRFTSSTNF
jgi:predicted Zn-dependent protease